MTTLAAHLLVADPAVPMRDTLLDPHEAPLPVDASAVEIVRCKYRVGESLRVLYRCSTSAGEQLVTVRASAGRAPRWWTFPDDRRLLHLRDLLRPAPGLACLTGGRPWERSEVAEYAPERSITVRALDDAGRATAYVKQYAPGEHDVNVLSTRYSHVARALGDGRVPRPLGWSSGRGVLVLDAAPGERWADLSAPAMVPAAAAMGQAIAGLHGVRAPAGTPPFTRLGPARLRRSVGVVATARPDLAAAVRDLAGRLAVTRIAAKPVLLHGDCHPKNAIVDGKRLTLIDLDQAGCGAAAADLGSLLARTRTADLTATTDSACGAPIAEAFLAGYASQRALPSDELLRWHTAAALFVEQGVRAVNRVRPHVLAELPAVLSAALNLLPRGDR